MKEMLKYYKAYIPIILLVIVALFGQAMCELALPGYMSDIINFGIIKSDMSYIYKTGAIMLLVALAVVICTGLAGLFSARVAAKSSRDIRSALFRRVTAFSAAELERFSTASLITRSTNDVQMVQQSTVMILRLACFAPIMGIGAVIKALRTSVPLSWTIALAVLAILLIMALAFFLVMPTASSDSAPHVSLPVRRSPADAGPHGLSRPIIIVYNTYPIIVILGKHHQGNRAVPDNLPVFIRNVDGAQQDSVHL